MKMRLSYDTKFSQVPYFGPLIPWRICSLSRDCYKVSLFVGHFDDLPEPTKETRKTVK
jgi:hypothetical protein